MPNVTLPELLARSSTRRKLNLFLMGAAAVVGAAVIFHIEYDPPLSLEECQFLGAAVALCAVAVYTWIRALRTPDPVALALRDRVVWIYFRKDFRQRYDIMLGTADGVLVPLRLDRGGVEPTREQLDHTFGELLRIHPYAVVGFSPELQARFNASARGMSPVQLPAGRGPVHKQSTFVLASTIALAVVTGFVSMKIVRAIDPGRESVSHTSFR